MKRQPCRKCPHDKRAHEHFSTGSAIHPTDCALCDCPRYRRRWWWSITERIAS